MHLRRRPRQRKQVSRASKSYGAPSCSSKHAHLGFQATCIASRTSGRGPCRSVPALQPRYQRAHSLAACQAVADLGGCRLSKHSFGHLANSDVNDALMASVRTLQPFRTVLRSSETLGWHNSFGTHLCWPSCLAASQEVCSNQTNRARDSRHPTLPNLLRRIW